MTFREPEAAMRACVDAAPVIDGRRANCNLASLGVQRSKPSTPKQHGIYIYMHPSIHLFFINFNFHYLNWGFNLIDLMYKISENLHKIKYFHFSLSHCSKMLWSHCFSTHSFLFTYSTYKLNVKCIFLLQVIHSNHI